MGYGDIMRIQVTGASQQTAGWDNLNYAGVPASHAMAKMDLERMNKYKSIIKRVGNQKGVDPALIAGIISRESRAGNVLDNGWGDHHKAFGLMQIDVVPVSQGGGGHTPRGSWNSEEHLSQATDILIYFIGRIRSKPAFSNRTSEEQLKGAIAAYNKGDGNVHSYEHVDASTTGADYSNDVVARAQWYKTNGGF